VARLGIKPSYQEFCDGHYYPSGIARWRSHCSVVLSSANFPRVVHAPLRIAKYQYVIHRSCHHEPVPRERHRSMFGHRK